MNHAQRAGKDHDNNVANALHENTSDDVRVVSMRGSGNTLFPAADVMVIEKDSGTIHDVELKRRSVAVGDYGYFEIEDLDELPEPRWFGVSFTKREMVFVSADGEDPVDRIVERLPSCFFPLVTDAGTLRLTKPSAGRWNSARSGKADWEVVADALDLPIEESDGDE